MRDPVLYRSMGARPCIRVKEPIGFVLTRPQSFIPRWMMGMGKVRRVFHHLTCKRANLPVN